MCCNSNIIRKEVLSNGSSVITLIDKGDGKIYCEKKTIGVIDYVGGLAVKGMKCEYTEYLVAEGSWENRHRLDFKAVSADTDPVVPASDVATEEEPLKPEGN